MAELITTDAEKAANSWLDLDDESIGKVAKWMALQILERDKDQGDSNVLACCSAQLLLVGTAIGLNATSASFELNGVTKEGEPVGDWKITIERQDEPR